MFDFSAEDILGMDYRELGKFTERAVIAKPTLSEMMKSSQIKEFLKMGHINPVRKAKIRCISAYLGITDPYPSKARGGRR